LLASPLKDKTLHLPIFLPDKLILLIIKTPVKRKDLPTLLQKQQMAMRMTGFINVFHA